MNTNTETKYEFLKNYIKQLGNAAIAFSGGVDSSLLAKICYDILGENAIAVTVVSPLMPTWDLDDAKLITKQIGIKHILIEKETIPLIINKNTIDRCFHCKKTVFKPITEIAKKKKYKAVLDGSNADDANDYRPGSKAIAELKILSPLKIAGLTKTEIRLLSKQFRLPTWNKPAYACLASRIPYGDEITLKKLHQIEKAESYLHSLGFKEVRVRCHKDIARIELCPTDIPRFCKPITTNIVSRQFKKYGFLYVCMELEGYSMGSLNKKVLKQ